LARPVDRPLVVRESGYSRLNSRGRGAP
jgi:hypothetical protein